jgi:hypothetical protein
MDAPCSSGSQKGEGGMAALQYTDDYIEGEFGK